MEEKTDLRIIKTQEAIHTSFEKLAEENELSAISVAQLCREARISKKTYYRHYPDLNALIAEYQALLLQTLLEETKEFTLPDRATEFARQLVVSLCEAGKQSRLNERVVCYARKSEFCQQMIEEELKLGYVNDRGFGSLSGTEISAVLVFVHSTCVTLYQHWVAGGKRMSVKRLSEMAATLATKGTTSLG